MPARSTFRLVIPKCRRALFWQARFYDFERVHKRKKALKRRLNYMHVNSEFD